MHDSITVRGRTQSGCGNKTKSIEQLIDRRPSWSKRFQDNRGCKLQVVDRVRPFEDQEDQRAEKFLSCVCNGAWLWLPVGCAAGLTAFILAGQVRCTCTLALITPNIV